MGFTPELRVYVLQQEKLLLNTLDPNGRPITPDNAHLILGVSKRTRDSWRLQVTGVKRPHSPAHDDSAGPSQRRRISGDEMDTEPNVEGEVQVKQEQDDSMLLWSEKAASASSNRPVDELSPYAPDWMRSGQTRDWTFTQPTVLDIGQPNKAIADLKTELEATKGQAGKHGIVVQAAVGRSDKATRARPCTTNRAQPGSSSPCPSRSKLTRTPTPMLTTGHHWSWSACTSTPSASTRHPDYA